MKNLIAKLNYLKSKTIAFFAGLGPVMYIYANEIQSTLLEFLPSLQPYLPENPFKTLMVVVLTTGVLLRVVTKDSLASKGKPEGVSSE